MGFGHRFKQARYAGAKLFSALYVNTALLYIKRLGTEIHSSLSNMIVEGVIKTRLGMRTTYNAKN